MSTSPDRGDLGREQLLAEARSRAAELALLNHINRALTSTLDYGKVLLQILSEVNGILGVEAASVSLVDEERGELVFEYAVGKGADAVRGMRMPLSQGILGWVVTHGEPAFVPRVADDPRFYHHVDEESGLATRSILCAPLRIGERVIGAIEALNKLEGQFQENELRLLVGVADQAAVAIENSRLYRKLERQSAELEERNRELLETQDRLVRSERLAALGQMGLAIRHEINNPLAAILARIDLMMDEHPTMPQDLRHDLQVIEEMSERIRGIVARLDHLDDRTTGYLGDLKMIDLADTGDDVEATAPKGPTQGI